MPGKTKITDGQIQVVDEHEQLLMETCPYTDAERKQVAALCEEERTAIRDYYFGGTVNMIGERYRIVRERVKISRAARIRLGSLGAGDSVCSDGPNETHGGKLMTGRDLIKYRMDSLGTLQKALARDVLSAQMRADSFQEQL